MHQIFHSPTIQSMYSYLSSLSILRILLNTHLVSANMRRRGPGIGGLQKKAEINNKFESLGAEIEQASAASVR